MFSPLFGWQPEADPTLPGVVTDVSCMEPTSRGLRAAPTLSASMEVTAALAATCVGAHAHFLGANSPVSYAATRSGLYVLNVGTKAWDNWTGVTLATAANYEPIRFASFDNKVYAALGSSEGLRVSDPDTGAATFVAVTGAPHARLIAAVGDFLMVADTRGSDPTWGTGNAVWWSGIEDPADWSADVSTQSGRVKLNDTQGEITALHAYGNDVVIFKARAMYVGRYIGAPFVWDFTMMSRTIGAASQEAVIEVDGVLYWCDENAFWMFDGTRPVRIPGAPNEYWRANYSSYYPHTLYVPRAQYDLEHRVIRWFYRESTSASGTLTHCLTFHVETGRWGKVSGLTAVCPIQLFPHYEGKPPRFRASVIASDHKVYDFRGTPGSASLTTGDIGTIAAPAMLGGTRPKWLTSPTSATATHYYRDDPGATLATGVAQPMAMGKFDFTHSARFHRLKIATTGACEINGLWHEIKGDGKR